MWVTPTEEEIFKVHQTLPRAHGGLLTLVQKYSPDLQKKALARREQTQQDFDNFTRQLKEAARSDKPSKYCRAARRAGAC